MDESLQIGRRLHDFGIEKYGTMTAFAAALEISPQNLHGYVKGERRPGNKMKARLRQLGADVDWIMMGQAQSVGEKLSPGDLELLTFLREMGIDSIEKAREILSPEALAQDIALAVRERMSRYRAKRIRKP
jgi:transcriptional regulator with XRE-family HTH domain